MAIDKTAITSPMTVPRSNAGALPSNSRRVTYHTYRPGGTEYYGRQASSRRVLSVPPGLALLRTVNPSFVIDNLGLDLLGSIADDQLVAGGKGDDRVRSALELFDQLGIDHDRLVVESA